MWGKEGPLWTGEEVNHSVFRNGALMSYFWLEYNLSHKSLVSYCRRIWHKGKSYRITNLQSQHASVASSVNGEVGGRSRESLVTVSLPQFQPFTSDCGVVLIKQTNKQTKTRVLING